MLPLRWLKRLLFRIPAKDGTSDHRGFPPAQPAKKAHLERILHAFIDGYHLALDDGRPEPLTRKLNAIGPELRGFAYEGAGLCLAAFDMLTPWKRDRWLNLVRGLGDPQSFILHVGYGVAQAAFRRSPTAALAKLEHPGERWLAVDGYGFYTGFFHWRKAIVAQAAHPGLSGFPAQIYDQGLGRSLWFGCGADVPTIASTIASFPESRQPDLWAGVGVACTFAGGVSESELAQLVRASGPYLGQVRVGSVLASKLRQRAGTVIDYTRMACLLIAESTVEAASAMVDAAMSDLADHVETESEPSYQMMRNRLHQQLVAAEELTT